MAGYRPPYTLKEDKKILQYIIEQKAYYSLRGNTFWKQIEDNKIVDRTWQSAKEHFRKFVVNSLDNPHFALSQEEKYNIIDGYNSTSTIRKRSPKRTNVKLRNSVRDTKQANRSTEETNSEDETTIDSSDSEEKLEQSEKESNKSRNKRFPDLQNISSSSED